MYQTQRTHCLTIQKIQKNYWRSFIKKKTDGQLALGGKATSYLFRPRHQQTTKLNRLGYFNTVLAIDKEEKIAHVGGMTTFYDLAKESLKVGLLPAVVPELRGITVGGAVAGMAIESSSFKGFFNRQLESEIKKLNGMKSLYSQSFFTQDEFERIYYSGDAYSKLKEKYDPNNRFPTLYEKCVLNR
ncbi:MAG: FAD-binding oxidoreductase [Gammaproteobacteria bacterium]|nr:FAD-binding oxidoreductase [Gammaproteobacteria bacterium]